MRTRGAATAGIVLAGGRSARMGASKAALEWHGSTLLRRACGLLARAVDGPVVVVGAPGQELPDAGPGVEVVRDSREGLGPLEGIAAGLLALEDRAAAAFVASTDAPFLHPAFVRRVLSELEKPGVDVALPVARGFVQPLAAGYRTALAPTVARLVAAGQLKPAFLFDACRVTRLAERDLLADAQVAERDPELGSLVNLNAPDEYERARGAPAPEVLVVGSGTLRAATLGAAAAGAGVRFPGLEVTVDGRAVAPDPELPLAAGDVVSFARRG